MRNKTVKRGKVYKARTYYKFGQQEEVLRLMIICNKKSILNYESSDSHVFPLLLRLNFNVNILTNDGLKVQQSSSKVDTGRRPV